MFDNCSSLAELNAMRIQLLQGDSPDVVGINNAYNDKKNQLLKASASTNRYIKIDPIIVQPDPVMKYDGLPYIGTPSGNGCITLTMPK